MVKHTESGMWRSGSASALHARICGRSRVQSPTSPLFCFLFVDIYHFSSARGWIP